MKTLRIAFLIALCMNAGAILAADGEKPYWVEPMKKVHAKFKGKKGTFAHFGDSITITMAFWCGMGGKLKNASPELTKAQELVKGHMINDCWRKWKGPAYGNNGRMTIRWLHTNVDGWLKKLNPEVALIMFGTNDLGRVPEAEYEQKTRECVQKCLDNGTIVILSTIPPRRKRVELAKKFADIVRKVGKELKVPVEDYQAEILKRRPDDWDGGLEKFKSEPGGTYEVSTLIARDGVHPSNYKKHRNDFSEEGLKHNGFTLRGYLTMMDYAAVIKEVIKAK